MKQVGKFVLIGMGVFLLTVIASAALFYWIHHSSRSVSSETAAAEFELLRSQFNSEPALLDMGERRVRTVQSVPGATYDLSSFHTVIFDTRGDKRLVHIAVPYWFARRFGGPAGEFRWLGQLTFLDDTEFDPEAIRLSLAEVERHGPGLIVDYRHPTGGQFISWVE